MTSVVLVAGTLPRISSRGPLLVVYWQAMKQPMLAVAGNAWRFATFEIRERKIGDCPKRGTSAWTVPIFHYSYLNAMNDSKRNRCVLLFHTNPGESLLTATGDIC